MAATKYSLKDNAIYRDDVKIANRDPITCTVDYLPDMDRYRAPVSQWLAAEGLSKPPVTPPEVAARQAEIRTAGADPVPQGDDGAPAPAREPDEPVALPDAKFTPKADPVRPAPVAADMAADGVVVRMDLSPEQARIIELEALLAQAKAANLAAAAVAPGIPQPAALAAPTFGSDSAAQVKEVMKARAEQELFNQFYAAGCPRMDPAKGTKTPEFIRWVAKNQPAHARNIWATSRVLGGQHIEEVILEQAAQA